MWRHGGDGVHLGHSVPRLLRGGRVFTMANIAWNQLHPSVRRRVLAAQVVGALSLLLGIVLLVVR